VEPFLAFLRFHEKLNGTLKTVSRALHDLRVRCVDGGEHVDARLVNAVGSEVGRALRITDDGIRAAVSTISLFSIVQVCSAFEDFCLQMVSEHDRIMNLLGQRGRAGAVSGPDGDIWPPYVCDRCGLDRRRIERLLPLYDLFRLMRNCAAHRGGRTSEALARKAAALDEPFRDPPRLEVGTEIVVAPTHAIRASDHFRTIALMMNEMFVDELGTVGLVAMAYHHALAADEHANRVKYHQRPEDAVSLFLATRYRVGGVTAARTIRELRRAGLWEKSREAYRRLYGPIKNEG
jgi:hypothetical protein